MMTYLLLLFLIVIVGLAVYGLIEYLRLERDLKLWRRDDEAFWHITAPFLAFLQETNDQSEEAWRAYCEAHGIDYDNWREEAELHHAQVFAPIDQEGGEV